MPNQKCNSLRTQFFIIFAATTICLLTFALVLIWQNFKSQHKQAIDLQREIARHAANDMYTRTHNVEIKLHSIATITNLVNLPQERQQSVLSQLLSYKCIEHGAMINEIILLDDQGMELARVSRLANFPANKLQDRSQAMEFSIPASQGTTYYGHVSFDQEIAEPSITVSLPIFDPLTGAVGGVLVAQLRLTEVWDKIVNRPLGDEGMVYITDTEGRIVAHSNPSVILRGISLEIPGENGAHRGLSGEKALLVIEKIHLGTSYLYIVTERPLSKALQSAFHSAKVMAAILLLFLVLSILVGIIVLTQIIRPIESIVGTTGEIVAGDLNQRATETGPKEIVLLGTAFNNMLDRLEKDIALRQTSEEALRKSKNELEQRVEERTTELRLANKELLRSESQFRRLVEKSPAILYRYSEQSGGSYYSPRVEEILGYTPEHLLEHSNLWHDSIHPDDLPGVDIAIDGLFHGKGFDIEYRIRDAQGEWHWFHDRNIDIQLKGNEVIVEGLAIDITERKQTANLLLEHHDQLSQISDIQRIFLTSSKDSIYHNILKHILEGIGCMYGYLGFINDAGDLVCPTMTHDIWDKCQIPDKNIVFPKEEWSGIWGESLIQKKTIYKNHSLTLPVGHVQLMNAMAIPILHKNELIGQLALANRKEDFTDENKKKVEEIVSQIAPILQAYLNEERQRGKQLKAELLLRKAKEEWEKTFNAMSDIITIQDKDMRIVRANKAAHDFFKVDYGDLIGKHCYEVFTGTTEPCPGCPELKTLETIRCHSETIEHEKLGKIFHVSSAPILGKNNEIEFLVHIAKDITEQKRLEEELFQSHKMEAIGTLAGGIAHDFNNILSAIIGFSKLAKQDLPEGSSAVNDIDEVIRSSCRAADLVQQILTFSRKSEHDLQSLNPHLIVKEVLRMLGSSLPSTVIIHEDIDKGCGKILADPTNIHQIMMNLCTNALHAMEKETGTLTVKLYRMEIPAEEIVHEAGVSAGSFVVLSVSDTGHGMDESTKEHIFEPYFTTKEMGKGTGMGLAVIHGIIQDYKGFVRVDSALGEGSTFSIYIPALQEDTSRPEGSAPKESETKTILPTGNERILVVDDEPLLVKINEKQLERCGYTVTGTTDSRDALEKIRTQPEQFDLLITDQTMPGLSGVELAKEVQKIRPGLPIILCTGHSDVVSKEDALAMGIKKYVTKPTYKDELFLAIREVLDEK